MISMRVCTQGIPIYFKIFKGKYELIFTADRWFNSVNIMKHIDSLGHTYAIRLKSNIVVYQNDKKTFAGKLKKRKYKAVVHNDITLLNIV